MSIVKNNPKHISTNRKKLIRLYNEECAEIGSLTWPEFNTIIKKLSALL